MMVDIGNITPIRALRFNNPNGKISRKRSMDREYHGQKQHSDGNAQKDQEDDRDGKFHFDDYA